MLTKWSLVPGMMMMPPWAGEPSSTPKMMLLALQKCANISLLN